MSFWSALGSLFSGGGGGSSLLDEIVVKGVKSTAPSLLQNAASGFGQGLSQGFGSAIGGSTSPTVTPYDTTQNPYEQPAGNEVEGVDVVAPKGNLPDSVSTTPQALSFPDFSNFIGAGGGGAVSQALSPMPYPVANFDSGVQEIAVTPPGPDINQFLKPIQSLGGSPLGLVDPGAGQSETAADPTKKGGLDAKDGLLALLGLSQLKGPLNSILPLVMGGMMLDKVNSGQNAVNQQGQANQAAQQATLGNLNAGAAQNQSLISRLTDKTMANLGGNIGGAGMNMISRMVRAAQARIRSRYSQMGMSGSTAEAQDLQGAEQQGVETQFKIANEQAGQGLQAIASLTGQNMDAYSRILQAQMLQGTALGNASAAFAAASSTALGGFGNLIGKAL